MMLMYNLSFTAGKFKNYICHKYLKDKSDIELFDYVAFYLSTRLAVERSTFIDTYHDGNYRGLFISSSSKYFKTEIDNLYKEGYIRKKEVYEIYKEFIESNILI